jgi:hypothetical protein
MAHEAAAVAELLLAAAGYDAMQRKGFVLGFVVTVACFDFRSTCLRMQEKTTRKTRGRFRVVD